MVTDPPYGVDYDPAWRNKAGAAATRRTGKVLNDHRADWREAWALFPGDIGYVWHGALHATTVAESLEAAGFAIRSQIIWAKERLVLSRGDYHWQHEPCLYAVRKGGKGHWSGDRKQTTLWSIPSRDQDAKTVHGTQKPVECMRRPILNNSSPGQAVYDPFLGSGTTLIAAETTGRVCLGIELNPAYVDVAIERWQRFTGQHALFVTGEPFDSAEGCVGRALRSVIADIYKGTTTMATGRPPHEPTRDSRRLVEHHAATGTLHAADRQAGRGLAQHPEEALRRGARARARPRQCRGQRHAVHRGEEGQHHRLHLLAEDPRSLARDRQGRAQRRHLGRGPAGRCDQALRRDPHRADGGPCPCP